ncbi:hypothetical protein [Erwinia oleae]|uniref:hypothetical protein n=1 Tax=Erwinia oleae TaxID=796334 RepID=UPI0005525127|nr:hypothetical protein [Erwinia oleae]
MSDLKSQIANLESNQDDIYLELHALRVAVTVLSTTINSMNGEPGLLGDVYVTESEKQGKIDFEGHVPDDYQERLIKKVAALLSKKD